MGDVVRFAKPDPKRKRKDWAKGVTMCKRGFHKWEIWQDKQFDVKRGKLVTVHRCSRCGETKTTLR